MRRALLGAGAGLALAGAAAAGPPRGFDWRSAWRLAPHYAVERLASVAGSNPAALVAPPRGAAGGAPATCLVGDRDGTVRAVGAQGEVSVTARIGRAGEELVDLCVEGPSLVALVSGRGGGRILSLTGGDVRELWRGGASGWRACAVEPGGRRVAVGSRAGVEFLDVTGPTARVVEAWSRPAPVSALVVHQRGWVLGSGPADTRLWSTARDKSEAPSPLTLPVELTGASQALAWSPRRARAFPPARGGRVLALVEVSPATGGQAVLGLELDGLGHVTEVSTLVAHGLGRVVDIAFGDRGLMLLTTGQGRGTEVILVSFRPVAEHPYRIGAEPLITKPAHVEGHALVVKHGCPACHSLYGDRRVGPELSPRSLRARLEERLFSVTYRERLVALDAVDRAAEAAGVELDDALERRRRRLARAEILAVREPEARLHRWIVWHLLDPAFDAPEAQMPDLLVEREEAELIARYLLRR